MAEKAVADARALMRALDQARDVGQHEIDARHLHNAKIGMERRKRVIGDLGLGGADSSEKRGFARIRQPDDARIRDEFQPQPNGHFHARLAGIHPARRAVGRGLEPRIAEAAIAAFRDQHALAGLGQVAEQHFLILRQHLRAGRHLQRNVLALMAGAVRPLAVLAVARLVVLLITEIDQRVEVRDALDPHVAAAPAVAAIGSAELDELLAAERQAAIAAVSGADIDLGLIEEFHDGDIIPHVHPSKPRMSGSAFASPFRLG